MRISGAFILLLTLASCDRMVMSQHKQRLIDAETRAAAGDSLRAVSLYESALEDQPGDAEVHYKLALLYDDKLSDPLSAIHHFKRYLAITPNGSHANDVKNFVKRDEVALQTSLSGDAVLSRGEATRLRNENLALRRENDELKGKAVPAEKTAKGGANAGRTYVVQKGDTLASISRKFFKTSTHWKNILNANRGVIDDPKKLTAGQTLTIPAR